MQVYEKALLTDDEYLGQLMHHLDESIFYMKIVKEIVEEGGYNYNCEIDKNRVRLLEKVLKSLKEVYGDMMKW